MVQNIVYSVKFIFLLFLSLCSLNTYSQQGKIRLNLNDNYFNDTIPLDIRLYRKNDELIYRAKINNESTVYIDSLKPDNYILKVYIRGKQGLTYHNVKVIADSLTILECPLSSLNPELISIEEEYSKKREGPEAELSFFCQTFQPQLSPKKEFVESAYVFGMRVSPIYYPSKQYGIGSHIGTSFGFNNLKKGEFSLFPYSFKHERYYSWKFFVAFNNRFVFKQPSEKNHQPWFLDISLGYNFPLIYRYVAIEGSSKQMIRSISNYKDFSAMARLAFGFISFNAEYRLTNSLKTIFPEVPHLILGIDFIIPTN